MPLEVIIKMSLRAGAFAALAAGCWLVLRAAWLWWERRPFGWRREMPLLLMAFYLAGLWEITVLRGSFRLPQPGLLSRMENIQWIPLLHTFGELKNGLWAFFYPVGGNLIWFLPFGLLLPLCWKRAGLLWTALLSALLSVSLELSQLLFASGVTDVDDLIFNLLGGLLGYGLYLLLWKKRRPKRTL